MSYQNTKKMTFRLAIFTALWLLSTAAATFTASAYQDDNSVLKISLILVNLIFGGLMIEANRRYILALDELQRRIHLQAMGITLGVTVIAGLAYSIADIGNPHCVIPLDSISSELTHKEGPVLETHPHFPNRTNVQFLKVIDRNNIQIEIWERGAGYTLASGSSSSAAAAVAHKLGYCDEQITVHMPGGVIQIEIGDDYSIRMTGPTTSVGTYELDLEALK